MIKLVFIRWKNVSGLLLSSNSHLCKFLHIVFVKYIKPVVLTYLTLTRSLEEAHLKTYRFEVPNPLHEQLGHKQQTWVVKATELLSMRPG